jgi:RNA polymerase sigma-70 factor, ECF subfamily
MLEAQRQRDLGGANAPAVPPAERLRSLFESHYTFIWRMLRRLGLDEPGADDGAQEVFVIAARRLADIRPEHERSFLLGTAIRLAHDARRARAKRDARDGGEDALDTLIDANPTPEQALDARRARDLLDRIIQGLPDDVQPVFVLFEIDGLSKTEIAEALSIPEGTVASRLRRAREHFDAAVARINARLTFRPRGAS